MLADGVALIPLREETVDGLDQPELAGEGQEGSRAEIGDIDLQRTASGLCLLQKFPDALRGAEVLLPDNTRATSNTAGLDQIPVALTADPATDEGGHEQRQILQKYIPIGGCIL